MLSFMVIRKKGNETRMRQRETMEPADPTRDEWRALFEASVEFRNLKPWLWVEGDHLFGIQDPETGEMGYCCVMGQMGDVLGMVLYLGDEGLYSALRLLSGEFGLSGGLEAQFIQKCLLMTFDNRNELTKEAYSAIQKAGMKFRGKNAWPQFNSMTPGYAPWKITGAQARFFTHAIGHAIQVTKIVRDQPNYLEAPQNGLIPIIRCDGRNGWSQEWVSLPKPPPPRVLQSTWPMDEVRLQRIKKRAKKDPHPWEMLSFFVPAPIEDQQPSYYPHMLVIASHLSGLVINSAVAHPEQASVQFVEEMLGTMERTGFLPSKLLVTQQELNLLLAPVAQRLDIKIKTVRKLPGAEGFKESILSDMFDMEDMDW
jgi:hypothetical protein